MTGLLGGFADGLPGLQAPSPPPPCPECGGLMGDGDRVSLGRCGRCHLTAGRVRLVRCWCGRRTSTLPDASGIECAEHDTPLADTGPSEPTTPGGVFDRRYP